VIVAGENSVQWLVEEERDLVRACLRDEQAAWQRLYENYREEAWAVLYRILGPTSELEDLVQTVFIKVVRTLHRFEGRSRISTWLYRICVHVAMDYLRKKGRRKPEYDLDAIAPPAAPGPDPHQQLVCKEAIVILGRALSKMKEAKRTVLVLHDLMEVSAAEIASMQGVPTPTVRSRLFYARRELARLLSRAGVKE
jgi:RNA polymerase sigma-70 factor (ECF subfamily)